MADKHVMTYTCRGKTIILDLCSFCRHLADPGCRLGYPEPKGKVCPGFEKEADLPSRLDLLLRREYVTDEQ